MARTHVQSEQAEEQAFTAVPASGGGVSFHGGVMHVDGRAQVPTEAVDFDSSNHLTTYTAAVWRDPLTGQRRTSCNCPGWAMARKTTRGCKHTRELETGVPCNKRASTHRITTPQEAEQAIPGLNGRPLRSIMI